MAWNIDDAGVNRLAIRRGEIQFGETKLNRDLPRFFFGQAIWISSSERFHERALAVIDVARRGDDEMPGAHIIFETTKHTKLAKNYKTNRLIPFCSLVTLKLIISPTGIFDSRMYVRICA